MSIIDFVFVNPLSVFTLVDFRGIVFDFADDEDDDDDDVADDDDVELELDDDDDEEELLDFERDR